MASTETPSLRFEKQGVGENDNTWGTKLNTGMDLIEDAIVGYTTIALGASSYTLSTPQFDVDEARMAQLWFVGALVSNVAVIVPGVPKTYDIVNRTSGGFGVTVRQSGGSGFTVPQGTNVRLVTEGVSVFAVGYPASADVATIDAKIQTVGDVRYAQVSVSNVFYLTISLVSAPINESKGLTITAAATIDLAAATGNFVDVSGETAIISFGSAVAGIRREVRAVTTINLTNNNNSLLLQGKLNTMLLPNDMLTTFALGSSNWIVPEIKRRVKPRFASRLSSSMSMTPNTIVKIEFGVEIIDNNDNYSTASYRFFPSVPGTYAFDCFFGISGISTTERLIAYFYKNGVFHSQGIYEGSQAGQYGQTKHHILLEMNGTSDYVEVFGQLTGGTTRTLDSTAGNSMFSAFLVD